MTTIPKLQHEDTVSGELTIAVNHPKSARAVYQETAGYLVAKTGLSPLLLLIATFRGHVDNNYLLS